MVIRVNTNVAPLGGPVNTQDLTRTLSDSLGFTQPQVPDPRKDIQNTIGAIPVMVPDPAVKRGIPLMRSGAQVQTPQDIVDYTGSPVAPAASMEPMVDDQGNLIIDPVTGEPRLRNISLNDYNDQLAIEKAQAADTLTPTEEIANNPYQSEQAVRTLLNSQKDAAFLANARTQSKLAASFEDLDRYIDRVGTPLGNASNSAIEALFTNRTKAATIDSQGAQIPAGVSVMAKMGTTDPNVARMLGTMGGVALNQAVTQIGVKKRDDTTGEGEESQAPEGTQYLSDMINSVNHFFKNGIRNANLDVSPADAEFMAKALVMDAVNRGDLISTVDPRTGRPILEAARPLKEQAMSLQRVADAMTGASSRKASSTTPNPAGTSFFAGEPKLTSKSIRDPGFVTQAANITKGIHGSTALVFREKDLRRKQMEIELMFAPDQVEKDPKDGSFRWSNHPFAKRNGVDENAYRAARSNVKVPTGYDPTNDTHKRALERIRDEEGAKVMEEKKNSILFHMQSISDKKGLRYGTYMHSLANQRFFPDSYDVDYMGSKNIIRDVMGLAYQDSIRVDHLFNKDSVGILKRKAEWVFRGTGEEIHKNLTERLLPTELGSLGAMHNAVMYFYTALDNSVNNVTKLPVADAIKLYTPEIGRRLAGLGREYNKALQEGTANADSEMLGLWVATEKGEALGTLNMWDDFARAEELYSDPATSKNSIAATHHSFDDGNQNGIFLQALFFGMDSISDQNNSVVRLGTANPNLNDMRVYGMETMVHNLDIIFADDETKKQAWRAFWEEAIRTKEKDEVAKDYFKKPLMQNAYGKDASMFSDLMYNLLEIDSLYSDLLNKHLLDTGAFSSLDEAAQALSLSVEVTLRQLIDSKSSNMMKAIGRAFAILNTPMTLRGITGDTYVVSPIGVAPINTRGSTQNFVEKELPNGKKIYLKKPSYVTDVIVNPDTGEEQELPSFAIQMLPDASKGVQLFLNRRTMQYDEFHNPRGMSLSRQAGVLIIQSLDGDLVKWTSIEANKGLKVPRPALWVHDSVISTPGQSLVYTNMYNNIAIPRAIPEIKKLGKRIKASLEAARKKVVDRVMARGEPVGIGAEGEHAALGALFDQYAKMIDVDDPTYKNLFLQRVEARSALNKRKSSSKLQKRFEEYIDQKDSKSPLAKWEEFRLRISKILDAAEELGWVDPKVLNPESQAGKYLAVPHTSFPKLLDLSDQLLRLKGPSGMLDDWVEKFADRVTNAEKVLMTASRNGGIRQMSSSGGKKGAPVKFPSYTAKRKDEFEEVPALDKEPIPKVTDLEDPFPTNWKKNAPF